MDLSEACGLVLFRVVREGIGISQRLSASGTCAPTGDWDTHPRTRASQEPPATTRKITGSIKGNVKENIPPSTGREELFLPSSPCPLCEMLGCAVLPLCPWVLAIVPSRQLHLY